jgi:hypothetical protein
MVILQFLVRLQDIQADFELAIQLKVKYKFVLI